jgi:hypothetical protein
MFMYNFVNYIFPMYYFPNPPPLPVFPPLGEGMVRGPEGAYVEVGGEEE